MKGKIYFTAGAVAGLLAGSRMGRGLYDRVTGVAGKVAGNETVRQGVSTAGERAVDAGKKAGGTVGHAAKTAGDGVSHKVAELRKHSAEKHAAEDAADGYKDSAASDDEADAGRHPIGRLGRFHHRSSATAAVNGTYGLPDRGE